MPRQVRNIFVVIAAIGIPILAQVLCDLPSGEMGPNAVPAPIVSQYHQNILYKIALNITLSVGLSLIIGFTGQFSLGHAGFMSAGAFASGVFSGMITPQLIAGIDPVWLESAGLSPGFLRALLLLAAMLVGMAAAGAVSVVIGLPALRLRGDYLAIATLGFGEITYNLLLVYLQRAHSDTAFYMPNQLGFLNQTVNVASSWSLALLSILVVRNLLDSTTGRALPAIRADEIAASAIGIRTTRYKLLAFTISSVFAGAAGVLEAHQTATINPASYRFDRSIEMIVPVVLGGSGSLTGCVLASAVFTYLLELLRALPSGAQQYRTIVYAGVLVLLMILKPQGLMGQWELSRLWKRRSRQQSSSQSVAADPILKSAATSPLRMECKDLTIRFGGLTAVQNFQLSLGDGEIVGLIGPNGAGKTTCFNMITGVYRPTSGSIHLQGRSLIGQGTAAINCRGIARTFQNIRLFSDLSVLDNVRIAFHSHLKTGVFAAIFRTSAFHMEEWQTIDSARKLLEIFDLSRLADAQAGSLAYGDQRRLEIARALATRPRLLCLDEPAAGMNPAEKGELMALIRKIRDRFRLTILLIEHDMKVVMGVCDRIVVLDHGETIAEGAPEVIRNDPKVIEAYLGEAPSASTSSV